MTDMRCSELVNENSRTIPMSWSLFRSELDDDRFCVVSNSSNVSMLLFRLPPICQIQSTKNSSYYPAIMAIVGDRSFQHFVPLCMRLCGGLTVVGNNRSYLVSSDTFASSNIQLVASNIFKSSGSPFCSPFIIVMEWHVAIPYNR